MKKHSLVMWFLCLAVAGAGLAAYGQAPSREHEIVLEAVRLAAEEHALKNERLVLETFLDPLLKQVESVLGESNQPLTFPYEKYEEPSDVALRVARDMFAYYFEANNYPLDKTLAEAIARDSVQFLRGAEVYGSNMPDERTKAAIRTQLDELETMLFSFLKSRKPDLEDSQLRNIVKEAMEWPRTGLTQVTNPYAKTLLPAETVDSIFNAWADEIPRLEGRLHPSPPVLRESASPQQIEFMNKCFEKEKEVRIFGVCRDLLHKVTRAYSDQWKDLLAPRDERPVELRRTLSRSRLRP
ncbi:MAG: hypothetical protein ABIH23_33080 [bacterium]